MIKSRFHFKLLTFECYVIIIEGVLFYWNVYFMPHTCNNFTRYISKGVDNLTK